LLNLACGSEEERARARGRRRFTYWLNQNSNGEIWINAEEKRAERNPVPTASIETSSVESATENKAPAERAYIQPTSAETEPEPVPTRVLPPENTLTAVRLLMQPKKRGEGVTPPYNCERLEKSTTIAGVLAQPDCTS